ncbi:MAG TPA: hypothetical protein VH595_12915 [Verrucomicrobiae bacterium]|nr:hypothetical protein [Verrucomicrobiae bacterium]
MQLRLSILFGVVAAVLWSLPVHAQEAEVYELPPVKYSATKPHDAVTRLQSALISGDLKLEGSDSNVVKSLLRILHIPVTSQMLVFSKTSFQKDIIGPKHPRALYYWDDCYVGWVPGGLVEIAAIDPSMGPVFYSFDPRGLSERNPPAFTREDDCMRCHGGTFVPGIPGVFARSLFPDQDGEPIFREGSEVVDDQTPFSERWGGWYVTGLSGDAKHRGNICGEEVNDHLIFDPSRGANVTDLSGFFDSSRYLTNSSDIVSLLVFEHQTAMQNSLTHAEINCRRMLGYQEDLKKVLDPPASSGTNDELLFDSVRTVFEHCADNVVDTLLFKDEAPLPKTIVGSDGFQKTFEENVPRSKDGSSLKDLLLSGHLFKNRCSYLIYSDSFRALPAPLKRRIYARLFKALDADHPNPRYSYIGREERERIARFLPRPIRISPTANLKNKLAQLAKELAFQGHPIRLGARKLSRCAINQDTIQTISTSRRFSGGCTHRNCLRPGDPRRSGISGISWTAGLLPCADFCRTTGAHRRTTQPGGKCRARGGLGGLFATQWVG